MRDPEILITTHFWGNKYPIEYVKRLYAGVRRHLSLPHRFLVVTDTPGRFLGTGIISTPIWDPQLTKVKGCTVRLRMFDPAWQITADALPGSKIVSLDIDLIVTGQLDPLFQREETFTILQGVNSANPCPFNGSIFMFKAGTHSDVWYDYSVEANKLVPYYEFPDDQGWLHYKCPVAGAWGSSDGVYAFQKRGWTTGDDLPANARIVAFPGSRDPGKVAHLDWVRNNWRIDDRAA